MSGGDKVSPVVLKKGDKKELPVVLAELCLQSRSPTGLFGWVPVEPVSRVHAAIRSRSGEWQTEMNFWSPFSLLGLSSFH